MKRFVRSVSKFVVPHDPTALESVVNCALMIVCCLFWIPVRKFVITHDDPTAVEFVANCALMMTVCLLSIGAFHKTNARVQAIVESTSNLTRRN